MIRKVERRKVSESFKDFSFDERIGKRSTGSLSFIVTSEGISS